MKVIHHLSALAHVLHTRDVVDELRDEQQLVRFKELLTVYERGSGAENDWAEKTAAVRVGGGGARLFVSVAKLCQAPSVLPRHTPRSSTSFRARHRRARAREQLRQIAPLKGRS